MLFLIRRSRRKKAEREARKKQGPLPYRTGELAGKQVECKCETCGKVWCYGDSEVKETAAAFKYQALKGMATISGNKAAHAYRNPHNKFEYFHKCPDCGSARFTKNIVNL